jgi:hypothetical protein
VPDDEESWVAEAEAIREEISEELGPDYDVVFDT